MPAPMMKTASISLVLALFASACSSDKIVDDGDDDGGGGGDGSDMQPPPPPTPKLDATGTYRIHSTFDLAATMPGTMGSVVNGLIAATDDPDDPMSWVLDQMLAQMPAGTFKTVLQGAKPLVAGYLNDELITLAPQFVGTIQKIGMRMNDLTKHFGVNEKLVVGGADGTYLASVIADGVRFQIDGSTLDETFFENNLDDVVANGVYITVQNENRLTIATHTLSLPYGKIVRIGLDDAVIPAIDPTATSLANLLDHVVDCAGVGQTIADSLDVGTATFWATACRGGLSYAADQVYNQIAAADSVLALERMGSARCADANGDYKIDALAFGVWDGSATYETDNVPLAQPATFDGARM